MQKSKIKKDKVKVVYLDYASSVNPNPGSIHELGINAKKNLNNAREKVAKILGSRLGEIHFTSGATESNNLAIYGIVFDFLEKQFKENKKNFIKPHIITTNIEHPSVLDTFRLIEKRGFAEISILEVEENGIINPQKIKREIKQNTILISVMYANNEIGTIQPIKEIAKEIRHYKKFSGKSFFPIFHTDAVQAVNYLDLNVERLGIDLMSLSGSKIENGDSIGLLYKKNSISLAKVFGGGDQEFGIRPGTENINGIIKFANALEFTQKIKEKESLRLKKLQDYFLEKLQKMSRTVFGREIIVNGDLKERLPNNLNITIPNIPSDLLVIELSARGVYVSEKSACKSGDGKVSYVIKAINPDIKETDGSIRFSFGRDTSKKDLDFTLKSLKSILEKLNKWYNR